MDLFSLPLATVIRVRHSHVRPLGRVRDAPLFQSSTLRDILSEPSATEAFFYACRTLPGCGSAQLAKIREVVLTEFLRARAEGWLPPGGKAAARTVAATCRPEPPASSCRAIALREDWHAALAQALHLQDEASRICNLLHVPATPEEAQNLSALMQAIRDAVSTEVEFRGLILLDASGPCPEPASLAAALPPQVELRLVDARQPALNPVTCIGDVVIIPAADAWLVAKDRKMCSVLQLRLETAASPGVGGESAAMTLRPHECTPPLRSSNLEWDNDRKAHSTKGFGAANLAVRSLEIGSFRRNGDEGTVRFARPGCNGDASYVAAGDLPVDQRGRCSPHRS